MSTPTPTPDPWIADGYDLRQKHGRMIAYFGPHHTPADEYPLSCRLQDEANAQWVAAARNELAAAKGECERLKFATEGHLLKTIQQQAELARLRAQNDQFSDNLSAVGKAYNAEKDRAEKAETELACEKENRNHLIEKGAKLETELNAMKAEFEKIILLAAQAADRNVELRRLAEKAEAELAAAKAECNRLYESSPTALDALTAELTRLRADNVAAHQMACAAGLERDQLRAELKELSQAYELNRVSIDELDADRARAEKAEAEVERLTATLSAIEEDGTSEHNAAVGLRQNLVAAIARAERFEAALAEWSVLNLWGGTPEIIHEFIKGQQNRIHHCQDLEAECLEQARLLGMSGEREADLLGKIARLNRVIERASVQFFHDGSDGETAAKMLTVLNEAK